MSGKEKKKNNLIKSTVALLEAQARMLEAQKQAYTEKGKEAKLKGLTDQYSIALSGLRMTAAQLKRVYAVKLNFELAIKTRDMLKISSEFLQGLKSLSEEMYKLTCESPFEDVENVFGDAAKNADILFKKTEIYIDEFQTELLSRKDD